MAFGIDLEKLTSPLTMLALTGVAFGSMSMVVLKDGSGAVSPPTEAVTTTTAAPAAVDVGGPVTTLGDTTAPVLTLATDVSNATVEHPDLVLKGTSEPGVVVAVGFSTATVDAFGAWEIPVVLIEGGNTLTVAATDGAGNQTLAVLVVTYTPPVPTTVAPEVTAPPPTEAPTTEPPDTSTSTTVRRSTATTPRTSPPATNPPATNPPATTSPATNPPATVPRDVEDGSD